MYLITNPDFNVFKKMIKEKRKIRRTFFQFKRKEKKGNAVVYNLMLVFSLKTHQFEVITL